MRKDRRKRNHRYKKNTYKTNYLSSKNTKEASQVNWTRVLILVVILAAIVFGIVVGFGQLKKMIFDNNTKETSETVENKDEEQVVKKEEEKKEDVTFTITALGDILCHNTQYMDAYNSETGEYDFDYVFKDIKHHTQLGDVTIANLETSFAGADRGYSNYPTFNSPDSLATSMKNIGVDIITTAGNHCLDKGYSGLERTIDVLESNGIEHLGTYKSQEARDKVFIKNVKGANVAFIDYTYGTNGIPIPEGKEYCVNLIDKDLISKDIEAAKSKNPDVIVACMHWGAEYKTVANQEQEDLADFLFKKGVNVIIGNHPHVPEQMEKKTVTLDDGTQRDGFVIYACGNFTADQNYANTRDSVILNIKVTKHADGPVTIDSAKYTPLYIYKNTAVSTHKFKLIDLEKTVTAYEEGDTSVCTAANYELFKKEYDNIVSIVGPEI